MKFAFDLDGTISAAPAVFAAIMKALMKDGHHVTVLTGAVGPPGNSPQWRLNQLHSLGVLPGEHFGELAIANGINTDEVADKKAGFCRDEGFAFMIDDTDSWVEKIRAASPNTLCLRMH